MQAVALVTGDEFLVTYNLTIDIHDVLIYIHDLTFKWSDTRTMKYATFDDFYGVDFAYMVGPTGFCYNFNMIDADKLFDLKL
jgi:hypothetical protein